MAGGAVRNAIMGQPVTEVDLATTLSPDAVTRACESAGLAVHPTGIDHGTVTVVSDHTPYEVTTLRHDVETDGRRARVKFTDDWQADAQRRDFTMNALYCDEAGKIYDFTDGYRDCLRKRIIFVGTPSQRIREDYLRILRFFRFHARFGSGTPDAAGLAACVRHRRQLATPLGRTHPPGNVQAARGSRCGADAEAHGKARNPEGASSAHGRVARDRPPAARCRSPACRARGRPRRHEGALAPVQFRCPKAGRSRGPDTAHAGPASPRTAHRALSDRCCGVARSGAAGLGAQPRFIGRSCLAAAAEAAGPLAGAEPARDRAGSDRCRACARPRAWAKPCGGWKTGGSRAISSRTATP